MAGRNAQLMTEDDGGDPGEGGPLPNGSTIDLTPPPGPNGQPQARQREPEIDFEIVDTDDNYRPINQPREAALTDAEPGDGTLLDKRRRDEQQQQRRQGSEAKRPRRQRWQEGRDRTLQELEEVKRQNAELIAWKAQIEPRLGAMDEKGVRDSIAQVDRLIQDEVQKFEVAEDRLTDAIKRLAQGDETATADLKAAQRARDAAVIRGQQLEGHKVGLRNHAANAARQETQRQQPQQVEQPQAPQPLPRAVQALVEDFADKHDWYSIEGNDRDSRIVRIIDEEVANDGFRPDSQDYWDEIETRMRDALPHRFQEERPAQRQQPQQRQRPADPRRQGPMTAGPTDRAPKPGANQVFLSPERKDALVKAGVMDADGTVTNKQKFINICKGYQSIDRESGVGVRQ